jgi:RHS repeat-associated protein
MVIDPTDTSAPVVAISTPAPNSQGVITVTSPVEVTGQATDAVHLLSWTLDEAPLNSSTFTTIATSTTPVNAGGNLSLFDPTNLADGAYTLRLTAWNAGGKVSTTSVTVNVNGTLKLGNLHLAFNDLTVPVSGIPITITRTYDSLNANTSSDFGYGWTLSESDYLLSVSALSNGQSAFGNTTPFANGTRVVITKPDGTSEGFSFEPVPVTDSFGIVVEYYLPRFVPDSGVTDTLTVPPVDLELAFGSEYILGDGTEYNPANPECDSSTSYTLTDQTGLATNFDATTGQVISESDRHGNTLTFSPGGIFSSNTITGTTGPSVLINRDPQHGNRITSIEDPNHNFIYYNYDPVTGDLVSMEDRDTNFTYFAYSAAQPHFLNQITDALGNVVMAGQYDPSGRLTQIKNAGGAIAKLSYSPAVGNSTESATAPGNTNPTTNTYNNLGLLSKTVDANNIETDYSYDGNNFLNKKVVDPTGQDLVTTYVNNAFGQVTQETDPSKNVINYGYDQYGDPTSEADGNAITTFSYYFNPADTDPTVPPDPMNGDLLSTTDPLKSTTSFSYDAASDVLTVTTAAGTPNATTTTNTYDAYGDLKTITSPQNVTTTNTYDNDGNLKTSQWTWNDPYHANNQQTLTTTNTPDNNGNVTETVTPEGTTSSKYDSDGRVYWSQDELGGVTQTLYDANGNAIQTTAPDGLVTDTVYDAQGRAIYTDDPHKPNANVPCDGTHTIYDQDGNVVGTERLANLVITVTPQAGKDFGTSVLTSPGTVLSTTTTVYNSANEVVQTIDASGLVTNNQYDSAGNLKQTQQIVNGVTRTTTSTYDPLGRVTSTTDALNNTTQYDYNAAGQVTKTILPGPTSPTLVDQYDSQGRKIAETDANNNTTQYQYDQYGQLVGVIEPAVLDSDPSSPTYGQTVNPTYTYTYDPYGNLSSITDAKGRVTSYTYDQFGHKLTEKLPMSQTESWGYNTLGQLTSFTDFNGDVTQYTYYTSSTSGVIPGSLETETIKAPNGTTYDTITYTYGEDGPDGQGNYTNTVSDTLGNSIQDTYDVNGNLVRIKSAVPTPAGTSNFTINYTYDPATGRETGVSTSNTNIQYTYDQAGEMLTATATVLDGKTLQNTQGTPTPLVTSYAYDLDGRLASTQNANGTIEARSYNALGELTSIVDSNASGAFASFTYTYDPAGHVLTETDLGGRTDIYTYDADGRLTQQVINDPNSGPRTLTWSYDLVGNRVASTDTGAPTGQQSLTYTYNADDELVQITGTGGYQRNFYYDNNGSTLKVTDGSGNVVATSTWDPMGRMTAATSGSTTTVSYTYDPAGNRTSETVNGSTTTYLNDPNQAFDQVLEEYAPGGVLAATYIRGIDLLFQDRLQSGVGVRSFYATDNLGSTRALTNAAGVVTDTYVYDAYGNLIGGTQVTSNEFLYAGMQYDAAIGQDYDRARDYLASAGRFTSRDSYDGQIDDPVSGNHYAYVAGDPVDSNDPSGHGELADVMVSLGIALNMTSLISNASRSYNAWKRGNWPEAFYYSLWAAADLLLLLIPFSGGSNGVRFALGGASSGIRSELVALLSMEVSLSKVGVAVSSAAGYLQILFALAQDAGFSIQGSAKQDGSYYDETAPNGNKVTVVGDPYNSSSTSQGPALASQLKSWINSGLYRFISVNKSWVRIRNAVGERMTQFDKSPDLIGLRYDGKVDAMEVLSKTDYKKIDSITQRLIDGMRSLPEEMRGSAWIFDPKNGGNLTPVNY